MRNNIEKNEIYYENPKSKYYSDRRQCLCVWCVYVCVYTCVEMDRVEKEKEEGRAIRG